MRVAWSSIRDLQGDGFDETFEGQAGLLPASDHGHSVRGVRPLDHPLAQPLPNPSTPPADALQVRGETLQRCRLVGLHRRDRGDLEVEQGVVDDALPQLVVRVEPGPIEAPQLADRELLAPSDA